MNGTTNALLSGVLFDEMRFLYVFEWKRGHGKGFRH